jgi:colicin import membrane protein
MALARSQHLEFGPPATRGLLRSVALALLAHGLLLVVLTMGIQWNQEVVQQTVEAELWSSIPIQAAAPAPLETPPEPEPAPEPKPAPPPPVPVVQPDLAAEAAIATAREKAKRLQEDKVAKENLAREKALKEKTAQEKAAKEKAVKEKLAQEKLAAEKVAQDKLRKTQVDSKAQKDLKRKQELADAKEAKQLDELRAQNLKRIAGMAGSGGNGAQNSTGTALKESGPSAGYSGRIQARIKPNIVFSDDVPGNPRAEVEIRTSTSSGAILSSRITQSSGVAAWDNAVLRAIEKTEILPKDIDGSIPTSMTIGFRPKD